MTRMQHSRTDCKNGKTLLNGARIVITPVPMIVFANSYSSSVVSKIGYKIAAFYSKKFTDSAFIYHWHTSSFSLKPLIITSFMRRINNTIWPCIIFRRRTLVVLYYASPKCILRFFLIIIVPFSEAVLNSLVVLIRKISLAPVLRDVVKH